MLNGTACWPNGTPFEILDLDALTSAMAGADFVYHPAANADDARRFFLAPGGKADGRLSDHLIFCTSIALINYYYRCELTK